MDVSAQFSVTACVRLTPSPSVASIPPTQHQMCSSLQGALPLALPLNTDRISSVEALHRVLAALPSNPINSECSRDERRSYRACTSVHTLLCYTHTHTHTVCIHTQYNQSTVLFSVKSKAFQFFCYILITKTFPAFLNKYIYVCININSQ